MELQSTPIAGVAPYERGYSAIGNLHCTPRILPVSFFNDLELIPVDIPDEVEIICSSFETFNTYRSNKKAILFSNNLSLETTDPLLDAENIYFSDLLLGSKRSLEKFLDYYIYIYKELSMECVSTDKIRVMVFFRNSLLKEMKKVRKLRALSCELSQRLGVDIQLPLIAYVKDTSQWVLALSMGIDTVVANFENPLTVDPLQALLVRRSLITSTIDPFYGGS